MSISPGAPTLTRLLCIGTNGKEVSALQNILNQARSGPALSVDGRFGRRTHKALIAYQRQHGLKPDGVVGPGTARKLGWNSRISNSTPFIISYEKPPLPAMTPPLEVIAEAIWAGMQSLKLLMVDDIAHAFDGYVNPRATQEQYQTQRRQQWKRFEDVNYDFDKIRSMLDKLKTFSNGQGDLAAEEVKAAFGFVQRDLRSALAAMDFAGADTKTAIRNVMTMPGQQLADIVGRVMQGEQMVEIALASIRLAFDVTRQGWIKPRGR